MNRLVGVRILGGILAVVLVLGSACLFTGDAEARGRRAGVSKKKSPSKKNGKRRAKNGRGRKGWRHCGLPVEIMKEDETAKSGKCTLRSVTSLTQKQADYLIDDVYGIETRRARPSERMNLAYGLMQISAVNGSPAADFRDLIFNFVEVHGQPSRQLGGRNISMNRCEKGRCFDRNTPHLIHEAAHRQGNLPCSHGPGSNYDAFARAGGANCFVTCYATANLHERYAEAVSAFFTRPDLFGNSEACQKVYKYFAEVVFPGNGHLSSCRPEKKEELLAALPLALGVRAPTTAAVSPRPDEDEDEGDGDEILPVRTSEIYK